MFASTYNKDVAGVVIIDHALIEPPVLISETPIALGIEDDRNFEKLPQVDQDLHTWAMSAHPQKRLLSLSSNSRQIVAENSTHMMLEDQPEVIVAAIRQIVNVVRNHSGFKK